MQIDWQRLSNDSTLSQEKGVLTHLLIDQGRWPEIQQYLYEHLEHPEFSLLFATTCHEPLLAASPLLLQLPANEGVCQELMQEMATRLAGVGLNSSRPLAELAAHFRTFLTVADAAGESYLRFYDPAIFAALWLSDMCAALGHGVATWWVPDWGRKGWRLFSVSPTIGDEMMPRITAELEEHATFVRLLYLTPPQPFVDHAWLALCTMQVIKSGLTEHWEWHPWYLVLAKHVAHLPAIWPHLTEDIVLQSDPESALASLLNAHPVNDEVVS